VLYRDVQFQHWDAAAQATAAAQVEAAEHAAASGVEPDQDAHAEHTLVMPADPVAPPTALNATLGPQAAAHRHEQRRQEERLYFNLQRAGDPPLSIDLERALEVCSKGVEEIM
jgi:hypothetical protein